MTEPWELVRLQVDVLLDAEQTGASLSPIDYEKIQLLADADALLVVARDVIAKCEDPRNRTRMTQRQQIEFLEMLRSSVLAALPEHLKGAPNKGGRNNVRIC